MNPILFSDDITHLITQICTLILAVLIWWVISTPSVV